MSMPSCPAPRSIISRFTILLLAAVLICLDWGRSLPPELTDYCSLVGLIGVASYISLEYVAFRRAAEHAHTLQAAAEDRLARQLDPIAGSETEEWDSPRARDLSQKADPGQQSGRLPAISARSNGSRPVNTSTGQRVAGPRVTELVIQ